MDASPKSASQTKNAQRVSLRCHGSPRQMGMIQGETLKEAIHEARNSIRALDAFKLKKPFWLPMAAFHWLAERKASKLIRPLFHQQDAPTLERMQGIIDGAQIHEGAIHLFHLLEPMFASIGDITASPAGCSAIAVRRKRTTTGETIIARNFDYLPAIKSFYTLRETQPQTGYRSIDFAAMPLAGAIDGMNEKGLCITYNYAFATDQPPHPAPPISVRISQALQQCATVDEAARFISSSSRWGNAMLMLADAHGDMAALELSSSRSQLRTPRDGEDVLFHTNAYHTEAMKSVEIPADAVFSDKAPAGIRGNRVHESSEKRTARIEHLLSAVARLDGTALQRIMGDHGADGEPSGYTPCVHCATWLTTASLQYYPQQRRMRVSFSPTCEAQYEEFGFE